MKRSRDEERQEGDKKPDVVTMLDIFNQQRQLEEKAIQEASEDWGDIERCTYSDGPIKQAVYLCKTCSATAGRPIGVCYGCYMRCHLDHDAEELFFKHGFRCDCGTSGSSCPCIFDKKEDEDSETTRPPNTSNVYNHNFHGKYCWCDGPYNPQDEEGSMIQCVACEDWFHFKCITERFGNVAPDTAQFSSFICDKCAFELRPILEHYTHLFLPQKTESTETPSVISSPTVCPFENDKGEDKTEDGTKTDKQQPVYTVIGWQKGLCKCQKCQGRYQQSKFPWVFLEEEEPNDYTRLREKTSLEEDDSSKKTTDKAAGSDANADLLAAAESRMESFTPTIFELRSYQAFFSQPGDSYIKRHTFNSCKHFIEQFRAFARAKLQKAEAEGKEAIITDADIRQFCILLATKRQRRH